MEYLIYKLYKTKMRIINIIVTVIGGGIGFIISAILQVYISYHEHGRFSVKVITNGLMT